MCVLHNLHDYLVNNNPTYSQQYFYFKQVQQNTKLNYATNNYNSRLSTVARSYFLRSWNYNCEISEWKQGIFIFAWFAFCKAVLSNRIWLAHEKQYSILSFWNQNNTFITLIFRNMIVLNNIIYFYFLLQQIYCNSLLHDPVDL